MSTSYFQYGWRARPTTATSWPDEDGELYFGGNYHNASADRGNVDVAELRSKLKAAHPEGELLQRKVTIEAAEPVPLPTPPIGSIVLADVVSERYGDLGRIPLIVRQSATHPYSILAAERHGAGIRPEGVKNATVLWEAAK